MSRNVAGTDGQTLAANRVSRLAAKYGSASCVVGEFQPAVERLEQIGRQVGLAERVRERLGSFGGVAAVGCSIFHEVGHLLGSGQIEVPGGDVEHLGTQVRIDAVSGDRQEPRRASGVVELFGHPSAVGVGAVAERTQIDRFDAHGTTVAERSGAFAERVEQPLHPTERHDTELLTSTDAVLLADAFAPSAQHRGQQRRHVARGECVVDGGDPPAARVGLQPQLVEEVAASSCDGSRPP